MKTSDERFFHRPYCECPQHNLNQYCNIQSKSIPKNFYVNIPTELSDEVDEAPKHAKEIGINWCINQCEVLINNGVKNIHFYIMSGAAGVIEVLKRISK